MFRLSSEVFWTTFLSLGLTFVGLSLALEDRSLERSSSVTTEHSSADGVALPVDLTTFEPTVPSTSPQNASGEVKKVCRGTSSGLGHTDDQFERYQIYKTLYTNCTHVDGNLEIVFLGNYSLDFSFLQNIREITGYVLLIANYVDHIPLTGLRIIRGRTLYEFEGKQYSLYIALNYNPLMPELGLKELRFTSLHEILAGSVFIFNNFNLCYHDTINWKDIISGADAEVVIRVNSESDRRLWRTCGECHESCKGHCWGAGPEYCQELTRVSCSPQCDGFCFGPLPSQCCHPECAGGCTGPETSQCWSCKNFDNGGVCENICPPFEIYSPQDYRNVPNPNVKYAYGSLCVDKCPAHLMTDKGACVQDCGAGWTAGKDRACHQCNGPCPKSCLLKFDDSDFINTLNINNYTGCTIIQGSIKILDTTFTGDRYLKTGPLRPHHLSVLESVQEVTDFVLIQANHPQFRDLSFLKNLKIIHGRKLDRGRASLQIFKTSLESLSLESLEEISFGHIYIANNSRLCYANGIKWEKLRQSNQTEGKKTIVEFNRNATSCAEDFEVCADECTEDGCWGPLDHQCLSCKNFRLGKRCMKSCDTEQGIFASGEKECQNCHAQCMTNCNGPGSDRCDQCKNAKDGPFCVAECPMTKYVDENNVCQPCHKNCDEGCTGPKNTVGPGGCNSCPLVLFHDNEHNVTGCLTQYSKCPDGFYMQMISSHSSYPLLAGKQGCKRCHPECATCSGSGISFCESCRHYQQGSRCVSQCTSDYYVVPEENSCKQCDSSCLSCTGPTASDCVSCKLYKVYTDYNNRETNPTFNCTETCPDYAPHKLTDETTTEITCVSEDSEAMNRRKIIGSVIAASVGIIVIILGIAGFFCCQRIKAKESAQKLTERMNQMDETEPLKPTDAKPDMSKMRIVSESELTWGDNVLGSGAFGTVFKGLWVNPEQKSAVPVAIKVLQEGSSGQSKEFLDEARIMSSVNHPCCVSILGICLSAQMMLITPLMPLGCLLEFIRQHKKTIGSAVLLRWCKQIAEGMRHLESRGIVHCDLAARNVLVEKYEQVKITDFGLAKMLEYGHDEYEVIGGKMPIKWLAIESITIRRFTHKTDVWSFGVTLWELFTFGKRPYENLPLRDIPVMLGKGERLNQPAICSIEIYMLMIKCWADNPEDRPTFDNLVNVLSKYAEEPHHYLRIPHENERLSRHISNSSDQNLEDYIEPQRKPSVRYTGQPTIFGNGRMRDNVILENELQTGKRPASSRLSDTVKAVPRPDSDVQYEIMTPNATKQNGVLPDENADDSLLEGDAPQYVNVSDSLSQSGANSDAEDSCYGASGPEYIPMSRRKTQAVSNQEYFASDHDNNLAKIVFRHSDDDRTRPRMDSTGWTESERSSTESEHDYYNFYNAALPNLRLNS